MPTVSIIIPCYNHARYICDAIDSVLNQSYQHLEILVIDDGSTDNTYDELIPYINKKCISYYFQENRGLSAARNYGIKKARGEYLKFLDSDDFIYPHQIELQVNDIINKNTTISVTNSVNLYPNKVREESVVFIDEDDPLVNLIESNIAPVHAFLIKKEILDAVGMFDEGLTSFEDLDLWLRLVMNGARISKVDYIGCCYRILNTSMSRNYKNMCRQKAKVFEKMNYHFLGQDMFPEYQIQQSLMKGNVRLLYECHDRGWEIEDTLPFTMQMQKRLFMVDKSGFQAMLIKHLSVEYFTRFQILRKKIARLRAKFFVR